MSVAVQSGSATFGILCAVGAAAAFSLSDMLIKLMSGGYALHEIVFVRAVVALALTLGVIMPLEGGFANIRTSRPFSHLFRGLCVVVANTAFFTGLAVIPLADATAVFFVAPLLITGLSVIILRESVGLRRWMAVLVGLAGVIIVVRPGSAAFSPVILLPLLAACAYAGLQIMTRSMGLSEKASTLALYIQLTFLVTSAAVGLAVGDGRYAGHDSGALEFLLRAWEWPTARDWLVLFTIGCFSATGGYLISQAYRGNDAGLVAPFEYVSLVLAVVWGFTIWGEWPDGATWAGITLIIASGVYVALRESALGRSPSAKRVATRR
ncbi:MAG: DMT family transporter [Rhodobacteraceae bacterium]|nr:DMT family transporter [Paracoccaceae bacterium]